MGKTTTTADLDTQKQLDKIVDLSMLEEETTLAKAFDILAGSVDPPLKIVVLWSDLSESAFIERDQLIEISGKYLSQVRLEKGLKLVLEGSSAGDVAELAYDIEDGVITIATADSLPPKQKELMRKVQMQPSMEMLIAKKHDLLSDTATGEWDGARMNARRQAIEIQIMRIRKEIANMTANDVVLGELKIIVGISERRVRTVEKLLDTGKTSAGELQNAEEKLARARIELAEHSRRISESAGGGQLNDFNKDLADLAIQLAESGVEVRFTYEQLELVEKQLKEAATFNSQMHKINTAQARLDEATNRVNALRGQLAGLARPTVTILSAE
jgi:hypothetical protein